MNGKSRHKSGYGDSLGPKRERCCERPGEVRRGVRWHLVDIFHLRSTGPHLGQRAEGRLGKPSARFLLLAGQALRDVTRAKGR